MKNFGVLILLFPMISELLNTAFGQVENVGDMIIVAFEINYLPFTDLVNKTDLLYLYIF